jgi:hypothetical protein
VYASVVAMRDGMVEKKVVLSCSVSVEFYVLFKMIDLATAFRLVAGSVK